MVSNITFLEEGISPLGGFPEKKTFNFKGKFNVLSLERQEIAAFFYFLFISLCTSGLTQGHSVLIAQWRRAGKYRFCLAFRK